MPFTKDKLDPNFVTIGDSGQMSFVLGMGRGGCLQKMSAPRISARDRGTYREILVIIRVET